jgi:two-component system chemotaxis sensor kinase CheA
MPLAVGIHTLHDRVEQIRSAGSPAAGGVVQQLAAVAEEARRGHFDDLARACREAAETLERIAGDDALFATHAGALHSHLQTLVDFGCACAAAEQAGEQEVELAPPPPLRLLDPAEDRAYCDSVAMFVSHAIGSVQELEEEILAVETSTDVKETVGCIRRVMHTLKAEFGVLNMHGPQQLCHQAETTIDACTEQQKPFPVDLMLEIADRLKQHLDRLAQDVRAEFPDATMVLDKLRSVAVGQPVDAAVAATPAANGEPVELVVSGEFADSVPEFIQEARSHLTDAEAAMLALEGNGDDLEHVNLTFRAFHTIKGVAGFLNLTPIVHLAHVAETLLDAGRSGRQPFQQSEVDLILQAGDMMQQLLHALEGQRPPAAATLRDLIKRLEGAGQVPAKGSAAPVATATAPAPVAHPAASDAPPASASPAPVPARVPSGKVAAADAEADDEVPAPAGGPVLEPQRSETRGAAKVERTVKVSTTRLDALVDMVGELVIAQSMVLQDQAIQRLDSQSLSRNIAQVGKITRDLQEAAMSLRMVTVKPTFQKMARLVRDVAAKSGKKVALTIQGEDTELDRNVVEQISDPLVHMIRNAIDHGIETPEDRRQRGKDAEGHLLLRAYHQGGSIVIEIQDDGRGIDKQRVVQKAVAKGLLPADTKPSDVSDQEAFNLIFLPGFSTAEKVTDLSGRGVGMDVVRRNIEALRGKIEIDSVLGAGTTFRMRLPLTLAIIDGMLVRVGGERYVVPTLSIEQSFRPSNDDVHHLIDRGECVRVRGAVLPVFRLKEIFAQQDGFDDLEQGILIVVELDGERSCLFVDEILGQQQVVIKSLGLQGDRVSGVSGGAIMSDGRIALILDVGTLVASAVGA